MVTRREDSESGRRTEQTTTVPEVWGVSEAVAVARLHAAGLRPGRRQEEPTRSLVVGCVFGTVPRAGAPVEQGEPIAYTVAVNADRKG